VTCHNCRIDAKRNGKRKDGAQRYRCPHCGKTFSELKQYDNLFGQKQAVDDDAALLAIKLLVEGSSIRSVERITGLHRDTIMKLLVSAGERCEALMDTKIRNVQVKDVQCDEIWSYVRKKESRRVFGDKDFQSIGDAWTFIAIERETKLVLAFELGRRTMGSTRRFIAKLANAVGPNDSS
jgi:transposase-like protein